MTTTGILVAPSPVEYAETRPPSLRLQWQALGLAIIFHGRLLVVLFYDSSWRPTSWSQRKDLKTKFLSLFSGFPIQVT